MLDEIMQQNEIRIHLDMIQFFQIVARFLNIDLLEKLG